MRITLAPDIYAEWSLGLRTINLYQDRGDYQAPIDCISFGYDKPDNSTTQLEALAVILRYMDDIYPVNESRCPACGDPIDYCQGHGPLGDPIGWAVLEAHDDGDHRYCNELADCHEGN